MKAFVFCIAILITLSSCEKWSHLDFAFDKNEYTAGDTVRLWRQSEKGKLVWIMPDGQHQETFDGKFAIDPNMGFSELNFTLKDDAMYHLKKRSKTKTVNVIPRSSLTLYNLPYSSQSTFYPFSIHSSSTPSNFLVEFTVSHPSGTWLVYTFFFSSIPSTGTYTMQSSPNNLTTNGAYLIEHGYDIDVPPWITEYTVGQLQIEYTHNKLHLFFSDIHEPSNTYKLSGNIYSSYE